MALWRKPQVAASVPTGEKTNSVLPPVPEGISAAPVQATARREAPASSTARATPPASATLPSKPGSRGSPRSAAARFAARPAPRLRRELDARLAHGAPLPGAARSQMETALDARFADVRIHTDENADALSRELHAKAFTYGRDIFFAAGQFDPSSQSGLQLLAHELTHVVQQQAGLKAEGEPAPSDDPHEEQADAVAERVTAPAGATARSAAELLAAIESFGEQNHGIDPFLAEADAAMGGQEPPSTQAASAPAIQRQLNGEDHRGEYDLEQIAGLSPEGCKRRLLEIIHNQASAQDYLSGALSGEYLRRLCNKSSAFMWADELVVLSTEGSSLERAMTAVVFSEGGFLTLPMLECIKFAVAHPNDVVRSLGNAALVRLVAQRGLHLPAIRQTVEAALDSLSEEELATWQGKYPELKPAIEMRLLLYAPPATDKGAKADKAKALAQASDVALRTLVRRLLRAKKVEALNELVSSAEEQRLVPALLSIVQDQEEDAASVEQARYWLRILALVESLPARPLSEVKALASGLEREGVRRIDLYLQSISDQRASVRYRDLHRLAVELGGKFGQSVKAAIPRNPDKIEYVHAEGGQITLRTLQSQIDILIVRLESQPEGVTGTNIERLKQHRIELGKLKDAELREESKRLEVSLEALEFALKLQGLLPEGSSSQPELAAAIAQSRRAVSEMVNALVTPGEATALGKLGEAYTAFIGTQARLFINDALSAKNLLPELKQAPPNLEKLTQGYARGNHIYFGATQDKWDILVTEVDRLDAEFSRLGDLAARANAPIKERLSFLAKEGANLPTQLRRLQGLIALSNAFRIGSALMAGVLERDDITWQDVAGPMSLIDGVINPLSKQLQGGGVPDEKTLDSAADKLRYQYKRTDTRLKELAEAHRRQDWFVEIASTLVGLGAMSKAMKALKAVEWFYRGGRAVVLGKDALRFVIGSLVFTSASTATRSLLKLQLPTPGEFAKQAGVDLLTLGILHGAGRLVGIPFGGVAKTPLGVQLGTTFTTLWAWSSITTIADMKPGERTLENVLDAIGKSGARTAIDLAAIYFATKLGSMPELNKASAEASKQEAQRKTLDAKYEETRNSGKQLEAEIKKWRMDGWIGSGDARSAPEEGRPDPRPPALAVRSDDRRRLAVARAGEAAV
jgi:Zn-dependent peptidase ImmA (M78 family)